MEAVIYTEDAKYFIVNIHNIDDHICIGTYIGDIFVITSATCATMTATDINRTTLSIGDKDITAEDGMHTYALTVLVYPKYTVQKKDFNVALILLRKPFNIDVHKKTWVRLPRSKKPADRCILYGWFYQSYGNEDYLEFNLIMSNWTFYRDNECPKKIKHTQDATQGFNKHEMFCGKDSYCISEDGAPLLCGKQLFGILSTTHCSVVVLEKVYYFMTWIRHVIQKRARNIFINSAAGYYFYRGFLYVSMYLILVEL